MKKTDLKVGDILYYMYGKDCTLFHFFIVRKMEIIKSDSGVSLRLMQLQTEETFFDETETWGTIIPTDKVIGGYKFKVYESQSEPTDLYISKNAESITCGLATKRKLVFYDDKPKYFNKIRYYTHKKEYHKYESVTERNLDSRGVL